MAVRNLTDIFILMRNNSIRNRHVFANEDDMERIQLVSGTDLDEDRTTDHCIVRLPPIWLDCLDRAQTNLTRLTTKITDLKTLQTRHLNRPAFDDSSNDEQVIDNCTQQIGQILNDTHRLTQTIRNHTSYSCREEQRLTVSVSRSLALTLQDVTVHYRQVQNSYLKKMQMREDRAKLYFDPYLLEDATILDQDAEENIIDNDFIGRQQGQQMRMLEDDVKVARQREQEVNVIVKSILDLNSIFKELGQMVVDQGTVLDRIDFNMETTQIQVQEGLTQLKKADAFKRKTRKMRLILCISITTIILLFIYVVVKS